MDIFTSAWSSLGADFVVAKETTGQWHVAAENPDEHADLYEMESRQEYAPLKEYLPTSEKNQKQVGGLEAVIVQELDSQLCAVGAVDKNQGPFGLKDIVYPPEAVGDKGKDGDAAEAKQRGRYRGDFEKGQWHGKGLLVHHNGDIYDGQFKYDVKHGRGTYVTAATGSVFKGEWVEGLPEGQAHVRFENGEMYEGQIKRGGGFHGKGTYTWPDGSRYTGDWVDGLMHGEGKYIYANGDSYEGGFVKDRREGVGRLTEGAHTYDVLWQKGVMIAYGKSVLGKKTGASVLIDNHLVTQHLAERNRRRSDMARNMQKLGESFALEFVPSVDAQSSARSSHSIAASIQRSRQATAQLQRAQASAPASDSHRSTPALSLREAPQDDADDASVLGE